MSEPAPATAPSDPPPAASTAALCGLCAARAPRRIRDGRAFCSACGNEEPMPEGPQMDLASATARAAALALRVGAAVVIVFGALYASVSTPLATLLGVGAVPALVGGGALGIAIALFATASWVRSASDRRSTRLLAAHVRERARLRGGAVTAADLAKSLGITRPHAAALLLHAARQPGEHLSFEIADDGAIRYLVEPLGDRSPSAASDGRGA